MSKAAYWAIVYVTISDHDGMIRNNNYVKDSTFCSENTQATTSILVTLLDLISPI